MHTRISEQLADDIRKVADELRVPVSNLVRNVLEEAFSVVETVSENVGELLEEVLDEASLARTRYRRRGRRHAWHDERDAEDDEDEEALLEGASEAGGAEEAEGERPRPEFPQVVGWQPLILNREQPCADCGRALARGERAFVGVAASGMSSTVLCRRCTEARS